MRTFLEKNKIFFEIFSYVFLGIMACIVSITQLQVSQRELELHENELLPLFRIDYEYVKSDSTNAYNTMVVKLSNEGKQIKNLQYEINTFYKFEIFKNNLKEQILVPVQSFYALRFNSNNPTGKLFEAFTKGNNKDFYETYLDCMRLTKKETYVFVDVISVYRLSYLDINNKRCVSYLNNDGYQISAEDYNKTLEIDTKSFKDKMIPFYDIDSAFISLNLLGH